MQEFKDDTLTVAYSLGSREPSAKELRILERVFPWKEPYFLEKDKKNNFFMYGMRAGMNQWPTEEQLKEVEDKVHKFGEELKSNIDQIRFLAAIVEELIKLPDELRSKRGKKT